MLSDTKANAEKKTKRKEVLIIMKAVNYDSFSLLSIKKGSGQKNQPTTINEVESGLIRREELL